MIMIDNGSEFMDAQSIKKKGIKYFMLIVIIELKEKVMRIIIN